MLLARERLVAVLATMRTLAGVDHLVVVQVLFAAEDFVAEAATVRADARVLDLVVLQVLLARKRFGAVGALVHRFAGVLIAMVVQMVFASECLRAKVALEWGLAWNWRWRGEEGGGAVGGCGQITGGGGHFERGRTNK